MDVPAMMNIHRPGFARRRMAGLSLIEMMIALVMALIVAAGIITVFASTSSSNKVQQQMAALQEEGRFAIQTLRNDLGNANGAYCANSGGNASLVAAGISLDSLNAPTVTSNVIASLNGALHDDTTPLDDPGTAFALPSFVYMRGYDCDAAACTPLDPKTAATDPLPAMGIAVGDRVKGTSVLTIRYLKPNSGWAIVPVGGVGSTITANSDGSVNQINLAPTGNEPLASYFGAGDLGMLADCSAAYVFGASGQGSNAITVSGANYAKPIIPDLTGGAAPRLFDFNKDFQTVTYYLKVVCADNTNPCTHTTGELERRVGGVDQPMVRGVERLDFRYGVIDANGNTKFLTAAQVDNNDSGAIPCPPGVQLAANVGYTATTGGGSVDQGCLWRAVKSIEAHVLMDGQTPLYTLTKNEMYYIYSPDGDTTPQAPDAGTRKIQPSAQGFPDQLLRREFTTLVALRNFNP
jgi:type IV pilus assembly protein PilW